MGAGDRWHEHGPVKDEDPIISPGILLLMQGQGSTEQSVLPWGADRETAFSPESTPDGSPESEAVLANLLRAIENTDIAALFPSVMPPQNEHPPVLTSAQAAEAAVCTLLQEPEPETDAAACSQATPDAGAENNEAITNLLCALQDPEVAATLDGIPQVGCAEPVDSSFSEPAATAGAAATLDGARAQFKAEPSEIVPSAQNESEAVASIVEPPVTRARRNTLRQQDRHPKRVVRRRNSDRRRSNNLPSIAAPTEAPAPAAAEAQAAEPVAVILQPAIEEPPPVEVEPEPAGTAALAEPAEILDFALAPAIPVPPTSSEVEATNVIEHLEAAEPAILEPVVAERASAELELPLTAEPELTDDTLILPAAGEAGAPKAPIRAMLSTGIGSLAATGDLINGGLDRAEMHLESWFQKWLGPPDPRRNARVDNPPLVAYHWIADVSQALKIGDISAGGLHLVTKDRWSEGNIVSMTLQRTDREKGSPDSWIAVDFLVMRWCEDGMAGAFMASTPGLAFTVAGRAGNCADKKTLERFMNRLIDAAADRLSVRK